MARRGLAGRGVARRGKARVMVRPGMAWHGAARDEARLGAVWLGGARNAAWRGAAWRGKARNRAGDDTTQREGHIVRRHARVDANHAEIRSALRAEHWVVVDTSGVGSGFPDLLIARRGRLLLVEIKDGAKVPSAQRLTEDEVQFHALLASAGVTVQVVTSLREALAL